MMTFPQTPHPLRHVPATAVTQLQIETFTDDPEQELSDMAARLNRFAELGISMQGQDVLDDLAADLAQRTGFAYAMVNAFAEEQTFLGLHNPPPDAGYPIVTRTMSRAHGWCPEVIQRGLSLPLPDVAASPRFQSNYVVDAIGIEAYFGTPIIDAGTKTPLLTVCIIDTETRTLADARRLLDATRSAARTAADILKIDTPPAT